MKKRVLCAAFVLSTSGWALPAEEARPESPPPYIIFYHQNTPVGMLNWSTGELVFVGNVDVSAHILFLQLKPLVDSYITQSGLSGDTNKGEGHDN